MAKVPFRLAVINGIAEALRKVEYENEHGRTVRLVDNVHVGVSLLSDSDADADVTVIEPPIAEDANLSFLDNDASKYSFNLLIQGFARENTASEQPSSTVPAYYLAAAIKKALVMGKNQVDPRGYRTQFGIRPQGGNGINDVHINTGVVRPADEFSSRCFCWIPIVVEVVESLDNPFITD